MSLADEPVAGDPVTEVARRLVTCAGFEPLIKACAVVARWNHAAALEILHLALPFQWIRREAAAQLADAVAGRSPVAINTLVHETAKAYADADCPALPLWSVHSLDVASSGRVEELLSEATRRVRAEAGELDLDLLAALDGPSSRDPLDGIVMLAVRCENADRETVQRFASFAATHDGVGVILKIGQEPTSAAIDALRSTVRYLVPELDADREAKGLAMLANGVAHVNAHADRREP